MKLGKQCLLSLRVATFLCAAAVSSACSSGFEAGKALSSCTVGNCASDVPPGGSGDGTGTSPGWEAVQMDGTINGGRFDQSKVVEIDRATKTLVVKVPFIAGLQIGAEIPVSIREIPGATVGIEMNPDGTSSLVLRLPLASVLKGVDSLPTSRLPNGDRLPAIPEGELPSIGMSFSRSGNLRGALYLSPTVVGVFVATKFDPYLRLTLPIRDEARTRTFGYFTSIPAKTGFDGGFFLSIALPDDLSRAIDDLL